MVASNSGESCSRNTRGKEGNERVSNYRNDSERDRKNQQGNYRGTKNNRTGGNGQRKESYKNKEGFAGNKPPKKKYNDRSYANAYDKDEDENIRPQKKQASSKEGKPKEQQPDRFEIINRIEKEKKAMQKKQAERKNSKPARIQNRPKRTNNIDWTREYENGSYDDDDLDIYL